MSTETNLGMIVGVYLILIGFLVFCISAYIKYDHDIFFFIMAFIVLGVMVFLIINGFK